MNVNELLVGDHAPELRLGAFLKGEPISSFHKGTIYIVECWATWCGPCIETIPHLTKLQKTFPDVKIIGVAVSEADDDKVRAFVQEKGETMDYAIAMDGSDGDKGWVSRHWLEAGYRRGIPAAFIVDGQGLVAWMGHPGFLDDVLPAVIAGDWDLAAEAERHRRNLVEEKVRESFMLERTLEALRKEEANTLSLIGAINEAFEATPELERTWGAYKLSLILETNKLDAVSYADQLVAIAKMEGRDEALRIGQMLLTSAVDELNGTATAIDRRLFDKGMEYLIDCERDLAVAGSHPLMHLFVTRTIIEGLIKVDRTEEAALKADTALKSARMNKDVGAEQIELLEALLARCETSARRAPTSSPTIVCDGETCRLVEVE